MDFILELPELGRYDSIMVAVNSVGKCSHLTLKQSPQSLLLEQQTSTFRMSGSSMASHGRSCPTADRNLSPPSWRSYTDCWELRPQCPPPTTCRQMNRQNRSIKNLNSTCGSSLEKDRTIGTHSSPWQSSSTITTSTHPHSKHPSSLTPANTPRWASNHINLHPAWRQLMSS